MTMPTQPMSPRGGGVPRGEVLGRYEEHAQAAAAVQYLAGRDFDVSVLTIIGSDLRLVEPVRGVLTWARAAIRGGIGGAWLGLVASLVYAVVAREDLTALVLLPGILLGFGVGILWGVLAKAVLRRGASLLSQPQLVPGSFEVICPPEQLGRARMLLAARPS